jgi:hypothetical protein
MHGYFRYYPIPLCSPPSCDPAMRNPCRLSGPACAQASESRNIAADEKIATEHVSISDSQKSPGAQGSKSKGVTPGTAMDSAWNLRGI